jgi:hypothetical protein
MVGSHRGAPSSKGKPPGIHFIEVVSKLAMNRRPQSSADVIEIRTQTVDGIGFQPPRYLKPSNNFRHRNVAFVRLQSGSVMSGKAAER